jgi:hypothetical protein
MYTRLYVIMMVNLDFMYFLSSSSLYKTSFKFFKSIQLQRLGHKKVMYFRFLSINVLNTNFCGSDSSFFCYSHVCLIQKENLEKAFTQAVVKTCTWVFILISTFHNKRFMFHQRLGNLVQYIFYKQALS